MNISDRSLTARTAFINRDRDRCDLEVDGRENKADPLPGMKSPKRREMIHAGVISTDTHLPSTRAMMQFSFHGKFIDLNWRSSLLKLV